MSLWIRRRSQVGLLLLLLSCTAMASAPAASVEETLRVARAMAQDGDYDAALELLREARSRHPRNQEIILAQARTSLWQGNTALARQRLDSLDEATWQNPDASLLLAAIYYRQGRFQEARDLYQEILAAYPDYQDAADGLASSERALSAPGLLPWRLDTGVEVSSFSGRSMDHWDNEFVQLSHRQAASGRTLHGRLARYRQFGEVDVEVEAGVNLRPWDSTSAYLAWSHSAGSDFRPRNRLAAGLQTRLQQGGGLWLLIDGRHDWYPDVEVLNLSPGLSLVFASQFNLSLRAILVDQQSESLASGWHARLDLPLSGAARGFLGVADAPETEAGITVDTRSVYVGATIPFDPRRAVQLSYARDDREDTYIRHVFNVSFNFRF